MLNADSVPNADRYTSHHFPSVMPTSILYSWPDRMASVTAGQLVSNYSPETKRLLTRPNICLPRLQPNPKPPLQLHLNTLLRHRHQIRRLENLPNLAQNRIVCR